MHQLSCNFYGMLHSFFKPLILRPTSTVKGQTRPESVLITSTLSHIFSHAITIYPVRMHRSLLVPIVTLALFASFAAATDGDALRALMTCVISSIIFISTIIIPFFAFWTQPAFSSPSLREIIDRILQNLHSNSSISHISCPVDLFLTCFGWFPFLHAQHDTQLAFRLEFQQYLTFLILVRNFTSPKSHNLFSFFPKTFRFQRRVARGRESFAMK